MIDIAMLTCNRKRLAEISITEIKKRTTTPHRLIVLDNGSTDGTQSMLEHFYRAGVIDELGHLPENTGVHWGFNKLLDKVESEPFYICTDPDIVPPMPVNGMDWLAHLIDIAERWQEYGAIACRPHVFIGAGNLFADPNTLEVLERSHAGAVLRIMRTQLVRDLGGWRQEKAPKRNNEEWYICGHIRKTHIPDSQENYKVGYARDIQTIHLFGDEAHGEDPWGYALGSDNKARGHRDIWPPVNHYSWDKVGVDWETCR